MIHALIYWNKDPYNPSVISGNVIACWYLWFHLCKTGPHRVVLRDPSGYQLDPNEGIPALYSQCSTQFTDSV